eukprot:GILK01014176.1.p1 GENE.GILK01014176.1~~GILK01014176.1.p1  ORF type:complete len:168 (-),score=29.07 GILK01014176.1:39-509(-)
MSTSSSLPAPFARDSLEPEIQQLQAALKEANEKRAQVERENVQLKQTIQTLMKLSKEKPGIVAPQGHQVEVPAVAAVFTDGTLTAPVPSHGAEPAVVPLGDRQTREEEARTALRAAVSAGDVQKLRDAIDTARELGLTFEAGLGEKKLRQLTQVPS